MRWLVLYCLVVCHCASGQESTALELSDPKYFPAKEAIQAVAVDDKHFYAIANNIIGKYDKRSGEKVAIWNQQGRKLKHLNSGVVYQGKLYCAHSDYPSKPIKNTIEVWSTEKLQHIKSIEVNTKDLAFTWIDRRKDGSWWIGAVAYGDARNVSRSIVARVSKEFQVEESYSIPGRIIKRFLPFSNSGAAWGPNDGLWLTGHDHQEAYVVEIPKEGKELTLRATIPIAGMGQGIAWDRSERSVLYSIQRKHRRVSAQRFKN